jgi:hypothetical protein
VADKKGASDNQRTFSLQKSLAAIRGNLSISLGIVVFFLCLALWIFIGYVLGKLSPEYMVTVQPFEVLPEAGNHSSLSGKSASDTVVDILNDAASHAAQFHGTDYYNIDVAAGAQPVSLHQAIRVPIQTSYGIELKGISVDNILHLYDQARYDQWIIGGDVVSTPKGLVGRIRLNNAREAKSWETPADAGASPTKLVRDATYLMLASEVPELLGQNYLQQAEYPAAEKVFRQWALEDPQNWKPSYYLSLVYSYQNKGQEASSLANWSKNLSDGETNRGSSTPRRSSRSNIGIASNFAQITKVALQANATSDTQTLDRLQHTLDPSGESQHGLSRFFRHVNVDYMIQRSEILDREALIEQNRDPNKAYELSMQAIDSLNLAMQGVQENGGLHEQRAILLKDLVAIMRMQHKGTKEIADTEIDEVKEYIRALQSRPGQDSALWGAVYAQIDLRNYDDAIDLARTITLLQPDSKAARAAYIVALGRAIRTSWKEQEKEKELENRLARFLESNPDEFQLLTICDALMVNNDREALGLAAAEAKRLFPENSVFEERMLRGYSAGLLNSADLLNYDALIKS